MSAGPDRWSRLRRLPLRQVAVGLGYRPDPRDRTGHQHQRRKVLRPHPGMRRRRCHRPRHPCRGHGLHRGRRTPAAVRGGTRNGTGTAGPKGARPAAARRGRMARRPALAHRRKGPGAEPGRGAAPARPAPCRCPKERRLPRNRPEPEADRGGMPRDRKPPGRATVPGPGTGIEKGPRQLLDPRGPLPGANDLHCRKRNRCTLSILAGGTAPPRNRLPPDLRGRRTAARMDRALDTAKHHLRIRRRRRRRRGRRQARRTGSAGQAPAAGRRKGLEPNPRDKAQGMNRRNAETGN